MEYTLIERILSVLDGKMNTPRPLGVFHILSLVAIIGLCALAVRFRHILTERNMPLIILAVGAVMLLLEIYKQLVISYDAATDVWAYRWYIFPFQFCSTPIYITLLAFVFSRFRNKLVYEAMTGFLATYALIAGTVVFCVPSSVYNSLIGVNIQTTVHHGLMIILAVALLASGTVRLDKTTLLKAMCVFLPLLVTAMMLNLAYGNGKEFDMFYLSPDSGFVLAKFREIFNGFPPYPVYLIGYIALFTLGAWLVLLISGRISRVEKRNK